MTLRKQLSVIIVICYALITGCVPVPIPLISDKNLSKTELDIKRLILNKASRNNVIATLGQPSRKTPERDSINEISYLVCETAGGVGIVVIAGAGYHGGADLYKEFRGEQDCYEFILKFDHNDQLTDYRKTPFTGTYQLPDGIKLDVIHSMALKGFPESQWRLYDESGRRPEDAIWLCRAADNGVARAQLHVGHIYWDTYNIINNREKAYVWYKLSSTGDMLQGLLPDIKTQVAAEKYLAHAMNVMGPQSVADAESHYTKWKIGQCEEELLPVIIGIK